MKTKKDVEAVISDSIEEKGISAECVEKNGSHIQVD